MPKTVIGLFKNPDVAEEVVRNIESIGFHRNEIQSLREPLDFGLSGVTSIPEIDFEVELSRELTRIGAPRQEADDYLEGLRRGGVLVFATGLDDKVDRAAEIMNGHGGVDTEETSGPKPNWPSPTHEDDAPASVTQAQTGRIRQPSGGAKFFVW